MTTRPTLAALLQASIFRAQRDRSMELARVSVDAFDKRFHVQVARSLSRAMVRELKLGDAP